MSVLGAARIARPVLARRLADGLEAGSVLLVAGPGYGKTTALEEAVELADRPSIWIGCGEAGGEAGRLLLATVQGLRAAVPGLADVVGDALPTGLGEVDVGLATAALLGELERLLVEPLVIVFDDAEELLGADAALALLDQLLNARGAPLSVAIATRRPLPLKLAKLRASGRLLELGPAELSFTAGECEELLSLRHGRSISDNEVEAAVRLSEGWPLGVALAGLNGSGETAAGPVSQDELFGYLAEEVLDRLDPEIRAAIVDSSVPDVLTAELIRDLDLPPNLVEEAERAGLLMRTHASGARSYHPLFRDFLRQRLLELRTEEEREALHARAAESLSAGSRIEEAIEHWLRAGSFEAALAALSPTDPGLMRTSPGTVRRWLDLMASTVRSEPAYLLLDAQLLWGAGDHQQALEPLRAAISGFRAADDADGEWLARVFLVDSLVFMGAYDEIPPLAAGWEDASGPIADAASASVAWYEVVALSAVGRIDEAEELRRRLREDERGARLFSFLDVLAEASTRLAQGDSQGALELLRSEIAARELHDPLGALPYVLGLTGIVMRTIGDREAALEWIDRCEREAERVGLGFVLHDFRMHRATLLAQLGELAGAEAELARAGERSPSGWRIMHAAEAEAQIAILRGDRSAAVVPANTALEAAASAPMPWRALATVELAEVLAEAGAPDAALAWIAATLDAVDERFPGERGRLHRAWLLASRACLEERTGDAAAAGDSLTDAWSKAGDEAARMVRAHWPALQPVLWRALAEGTIPAQAVLPAIRDAFPGGAALVAVLDHPDPAVRRAALLAALSSGHPAVLARLPDLARDDDEQVAAAALATQERLRSRPPALRFELLGRFRVLRAGWELDEAGWKRPITARVVRFLLVQESDAIPEDELFEAFWADKPTDTARQNLAAAISRARKVLDLPGSEESVIELRERTYSLRLRERDSVDAVEFEVAAATALAEHGAGRRAALERAAALWIGEPLPEDRYAEWSFTWRERLVETYTQVLDGLVESYGSSGDHDDAIRAARRLLDVDPSNERAHRQLMVAYARTGRTSHALRQYLECRRALVTDLGVEPSAQTSQLQGRILAGEPV